MHIVFAWAPAVLYMAVIWLISAMRIDNDAIELFPLKDKGIHFVEYTVLGVLVAHACVRTFKHRGTLRPLVVAVLVTAAWGLLDEMHQAYVPGREADPIDLLADVAGAITGAALWYAWRMRGSRRPSPSEEPQA